MVSPKRMVGEAWEVFKNRRRIANNQAKADKYNRPVRIHRPQAKAPPSIRIVKEFRSEPQGKRNRNEGHFDFRQRRKIANLKRREREKAWDFDFEMDSTPETRCGQLRRKHRMKRIHHSKTICIYPGCSGHV